MTSWHKDAGREGGMSERWLGFSAVSERGELVRALRSVDPQASVAFAHNAEELRAQVLGHNRGRLGVVVGLTDSGVSAVNLAAALAKDGVASEVVLVARGASGSLRSRALSAGVSQVIDVSLLPASTLHVDPMDDIDEPDLPSEVVPTTLLVPSTPSPEQVPDVTCERRRMKVWDRPGRDVREPRSGQWHIVEGSQPEVPHRHVSRPSTGPGQAPILTFVSGRGGVGKTTLVAGEAAVAASWGMRVALCDLDLSCGNLYSLFGLAHGVDLARLDGSDDILMGMSEPALPGARLWGPCDRPEMAEVVMPYVTDMLRSLATQYDLVLVDTSTTFTDAVAQAAQAADRLVLVSDGGPGTAVALARLGSLAVRLGVARTRIVRLANRCDPKGRDEVVLNRAEVGLETARNLRVLEGGDEVGELMAAGCAGECIDAVPAFGESVASVLAKVLSEMGRLPACEQARAAARDDGTRKRRWFGRRREVG